MSGLVVLVRTRGTDDVPVYHFTSGQLNGITWHQVGMYSLYPDHNHVSSKLSEVCH